MPRPFLLLEVEGVLNAYAAPQCNAGFSERTMCPGEEPVRLSVHATWITDLGGVFDVVWATGWNDDANRSSPLSSALRPSLW